MSSAETMATGGRAKGGVAAQAESLADQNKNPSASKNAYGQSRGNQGLRFQAATDRVVPKMEMEPEAITQAESAHLFVDDPLQGNLLLIPFSASYLSRYLGKGVSFRKGVTVSCGRWRMSPSI